MAKEEKFLLVSLKEEESKKLAQVISSPTSRKILDKLAEKAFTETELAKELNLPLSTVHYNLQHLVKAKLVNADEFHYSEKGKEILHYSLAKKYVIIAPETAPEGLKEKLKRIIPVALLVGGAASLIKFFSTKATFGVAKTAMREAAPVAMEKAMKAVPSLTEEAVQAAPIAAEEVAIKGIQIIPQQPIALWFIYGAAFTLIIYLIIDYIVKKLRK